MSRREREHTGERIAKAEQYPRDNASAQGTTRIYIYFLMKGYLAAVQAYEYATYSAVSLQNI